jgi:hypothetical protein
LVARVNISSPPRNRAPARRLAGPPTAHEFKFFSPQFWRRAENGAQSENGTLFARKLAGWRGTCREVEIFEDPEIFEYVEISECGDRAPCRDRRHCTD